MMTHPTQAVGQRAVVAHGPDKGKAGTVEQVFNWYGVEWRVVLAMDDGTLREYPMGQTHREQGK